MIRLVLIYKDAYGTRYVVPNCLSRNENNSTNWNNCTGPISKVSIDTNVCEKTDNQYEKLKSLSVRYDVSVQAVGVMLRFAPLEPQRETRVSWRDRQARRK